MMKSKAGKLIVVIAIFLGIGAMGTLLDGRLRPAAARGLAQPALPARFYGDVTLNSGNIAAGTLFSATIGQRVYATTVITLVQGVSSYVIDIPGDDPGTTQVDGGREGDVVLFTIPGYTAIQSGIWHAGAITALSLALAPDPTPTPTATSSPVMTTTVTPPFPATATVVPPITATRTPALSPPVTVPEPATVLLVGIGIAGGTILGVRRRRRSR